MNDYLTKLAARALGLANVVQPRRPSLFEPPPAAMSEDTGPFWEQEATAVSQPPKSSPRQPAPHPEVRRQQPQAKDQASLPQSEDRVPQPLAIAEPRDPTGPPAQPQPDQSGLGPPDFETVSRSTRSDAPESQPRETRSVEKLQEPSATTLAEARVASPVLVLPAASATPSDQPVRPAKRTSSRDGAARPTLAPPPEPQANFSGEPADDTSNEGQILMPPAPAPMVVPAMPAAMVPTREERTPTIQVTIGRIEVRAVPPAAPAAKPRRDKSPQLSLSEYLLQRTDGRRK